MPVAPQLHKWTRGEKEAASVRRQRSSACSGANSLCASIELECTRADKAEKDKGF